MAAASSGTEMLRIVADHRIPGTEAFSEFGLVERVPAERIAPKVVEHADVLLVRSVTRVGPELLEGSRVRFVGTATSGTDHVDLRWLAARGIAFASAAGSNARAVAQYVVAAILALRPGLLESPGPARLGVVGVGHVGSMVARLARAMGMEVVGNDPPRARREGPEGFVPLRELLEWSDVVTLHVPLTTSGPDATLHLAGRGFFETMRPGSTFINTSRGDVLAPEALRAALPELAGVALDVWPGEPSPPLDLVEACRIATPHLAGYTAEAKLRATAMLRAALEEHLGMEPGPTEPELDHVALRWEPQGGSWVRGVADVVLRACPLPELTERFRDLAHRRGPAVAFREVRHSWLAREFPWVRVIPSDAPHPRTAGVLSSLGFHVVGP